MKKNLLTGLVVLLLVACGNQSKQESVVETTVQEETAKVLVYYFHGKQRCRSCVAIQQVAQETIEQEFTGNVDVKFVEIDFTEKSNEALAEKYEVAWSSLIVVSGENHFNMTDEAFAKAMSDPVALRTSIVNIVNSYLAL